MKIVLSIFNALVYQGPQEFQLLNGAKETKLIEANISITRDGSNR